MVMGEAEFPDGSRGMRQFIPTCLELGDDSLQNKSLVKVINKEDALYFRLYSYTPQRITKHQLLRK